MCNELSIVQLGINFGFAYVNLNSRFIDLAIDTAMERVRKRHISTGFVLLTKLIYYHLIYGSIYLIPILL